MNNALIVTGVIVASTGVSAQSASVTLSTLSTSVTPGETITVMLESQFDTAGAAPGVFGAAGLYGFGGEVVASGTAAPGSSPSGPMLDPQLDFAPVTELPAAPNRYVLAAAGRGFNGGLAGPSQNLVMVDVTIDASASDGDTLVLSYEGAVVLALADSLVTFSTAPGVNQQTLSTTDLTLTVTNGRLCADQNGDGLVTPADFNSWILNFNTGSLVADTNQDGLITPADFNSWILAFNQGTNGPTCSP